MNRFAVIFLLLSATLFAAPQSVITADKVRTTEITNLAGTGSPSFTNGFPGVVPIGAIIPVIAGGMAASWQPPATGVIKDGFMLCDGATVPSGQGSPLQGLALPTMNDSRYLVGSATGGTAVAEVATGSGGSATQAMASHTHYMSPSSGTAYGQAYVKISFDTPGSPGTWFDVLTDGGSLIQYYAKQQFRVTNSLVSFSSVNVSMPSTPVFGRTDIMATGAGTMNLSHTHTAPGTPKSLQVVYVMRVK